MDEGDVRNNNPPEGIDILGLLFGRLESACITLGQQQAAAQYAANVAINASNLAKSIADKREAYLLDQLNQKRGPDALESGIEVDETDTEWPDGTD